MFAAIVANPLQQGQLTGAIMCEKCSIKDKSKLLEFKETPNTIANASRLDPDEYCPVLIISPEGMVNGMTFQKIQDAIAMAQKRHLYMNITRTGITISRTTGVELLRSFFPDAKSVRGWMIDSDVEIVDMDGKVSQRIASAMARADREKTNFIIPYASVSADTGVLPGLWHSSLHKYTLEDYHSLKDWDTVGLAGLGMYYGEIPLNYVFHEDKGVGEDFAFFMDNNIELHVLKSVITRHHKTFPFIIPQG